MEYIFELADQINKELGIKAITLEINADKDIYYINVNDGIDNIYISDCEDETDLHNTLFEMLNGVKLAKAVFKKYL